MVRIMLENVKLNVVNIQYQNKLNNVNSMKNDNNTNFAAFPVQCHVFLYY